MSSIRSRDDLLYDAMAGGENATQWQGLRLFIDTLMVSNVEWQSQTEGGFLLNSGRKTEQRRKDVSILGRLPLPES